MPPVVTPLTADERVDEAGLARQLGRLLDAGVHGIYFLGSTGEQPALRDGEKRRAQASPRIWWRRGKRSGRDQTWLPSRGGVISRRRCSGAG